MTPEQAARAAVVKQALLVAEDWCVGYPDGAGTDTIKARAAATALTAHDELRDLLAVAGVEVTDVQTTGTPCGPLVSVTLTVESDTATVTVLTDHGHDPILDLVSSAVTAVQTLRDDQSTPTPSNP